MKIYEMSSTKPCIERETYGLDSPDYGDFKEDFKSKTPPGMQWIYYIADKLDYYLVRSFPLYWDAQGVHLLRCREDNTSDYEYLAIVNHVYDEEVVIGIHGPPELFQFYVMIQPFLMLESSKHFSSDDDGRWKDGDNWRNYINARR